MKNQIKEFIKIFVEGVENILLETNKTTLYVDSELVDFLDIEEVDEDLLNRVINIILLELIQKKYGACRASYNEITATKEN